MVRDGFPYVVVPAVLSLPPAFFGYWPISLGLLAVAGFMAFFFRDPRRTIPTEPGIVVAPADGRVTVVKRADGQNAESLVSIFLSPLDVHINRSPIAGRVTDISYTRGKFLMATDERASLVNEQNALTRPSGTLSRGERGARGIPLLKRLFRWRGA